MREVEVQTTKIGDTIFRITANQFPSPAVAGTFMSNAEYFYINNQRVEREDFDVALMGARKADAQAQANQSPNTSL